MILYTLCQSCKTNIPIKSNALTRPELSMERGDEFNVNCQDCGITQKKHVNDVKSKQNNTIVLGGWVISAIVTLFLILFVGLIGTITFTIPLLIWQQQQSAANAFNSYRVKKYRK